MSGPRLLLLTDRGQAATRGRSVAATVADALDGGRFDVVVREKDLPRQERARLVAELIELARPRGARVLVASDVALAYRLGADGVHLAAADPWPDLPTGLVGRSCHRPSELAPVLLRASYATVSPVFATPSKPGYGPPLGLDGLRRAVADAPPAVLALGGVAPESAAACLEAGAAGLAVMGAVMAARSPAAVVDALRRALDTADGASVAAPA